MEVRIFWILTNKAHSYLSTTKAAGGRMAALMSLMGSMASLCNKIALAKLLELLGLATQSKMSPKKVKKEKEYLFKWQNKRLTGSFIRCRQRGGWSILRKSIPSSTTVSQKTSLTALKCSAEKTENCSMDFWFCIRAGSSCPTKQSNQSLIVKILWR